MSTSEHTITIPALDTYGHVSEATVAELFSKMVNVMGTEGFDFANIVVNDHRTLVQKSAAVFLTFFNLLAIDADGGHFDLRDEQSAKLAQKIRDLMVAEGVYIRDGAVKLAYV